MPSFPTFFTSGFDPKSFDSLNSIRTKIYVNPAASPFERNPLPNQKNAVPRSLKALVQDIDEGSFFRERGAHMASSEALARAHNRMETICRSGECGPSSLLTHLPDEVERERLRDEVLFTNSALSQPTNAFKSLKSIELYIHNTKETSENKLTLSRAKMLAAHHLMHHAESAAVPNPELFEKALRYAREANGKIDNAADEFSERRMHLYSHLLTVEILSRLIISTHARRLLSDRDERILAIEAELNYARENHYDKKDALGIIGEYHADVGILFARLGLIDFAISRAKTLTTGVDKDQMKPAASRLLRHEAFKPFVDDETGKLKSEKEIRKNPIYRALKWAQAILANQHSGDMLESVKWGLSGAATGEVINWLANGELGMFSGLIGGVTFLLGKGLLNGAKTLEAKTAKKYGIYDRAVSDSAKDVGKMLIRGAGQAVMLAIPSAFMELALTNPESFGILPKTMAAGWHTYGDIFQRLGLGVRNFITNPEALSHFKHLTAPEITANVLYHFYTKGSLAVFFLDLLSPRTRHITRKMAPAFILGALMFSADAGDFIAGTTGLDLMPRFDQHDWWMRVHKSATAVAEIFIGLAATGAISFALRKKNKSAIGEEEESILESLGDSIFRKTNYALLAGTGIMIGVSNPTGGAMQETVKNALGLSGRGFHAVELTYAENALMGVGIEFWLIGLALGLSGLAKQQIQAILASREEIEDAWKNDNVTIHSRMKAGISGFFLGFNTPYFWNRLLRIFTWNLGVTPFRLGTEGGYDSPMGQYIQSGLGVIAINPTMTAAYPETGNSRYEREAIAAFDTVGRIQKQLQDGEIDEREARRRIKNVLDSKEVRNFFEKAGQNIIIPHNAMEWPATPAGVWAWMYPSHAVKRSVSLPDFPERPNRFMYGNFFGMLMEEIGVEKSKGKGKGKSSIEELDEEQIALILDYIKNDSENQDNFYILQPLVKTMAMARNTQRFGDMIESFFNENPWVATAANIDLKDYVITEEELKNSTRRELKKKVRVEVNMSIGKYEKLVKGYISVSKKQKAKLPKVQPGRSPHLDGLFQTHPTEIETRPEGVIDLPMASPATKRPEEMAKGQRNGDR